MLFMRICVITYYSQVVVGPGTHLCTLLEGWVLGVGMSTLGAETVRPGSGVPITDGLEYDGVSLGHMAYKIGPN